MPDNDRPVSPVNGVPLPEGTQFQQEINANQTDDQFTLFNIDFDLDFDLSDFEIIDKLTEHMGETPKPQERILQPRIDKDEILHTVMFDNAKAFAKQICLEPHTRTFAWVSGNFIFGDILEALVTKRRVGIKRLYVASLSINQENIDSLKNVMLLMGSELEKLVLVLSGYFYSHYKYDLVPYMYDELDDGTDRVQLAFGAWHTKVITIETVHGHTITIHGSANMRSSNSIEQIMIEVDARDLHDFNAKIMDNIAERFGTINYAADKARFHRLEGKEAWQTTSKER